MRAQGRTREAGEDRAFGDKPADRPGAQGARLEVLVERALVGSGDILEHGGDIDSARRPAGSMSALRNPGGIAGVQQRAGTGDIAARTRQRRERAAVHHRGRQPFP